MKAIALFSGGLDSMLSIKLITSQGIDVLAIYIDTGFGVNEDKFQILEKRAKMAGANFKVVDIKSKYLQEVLLNPKYGYGGYFNPCIDCHGYMFKTAMAMLKDEDASFIISGEVIGQRPMSQRKKALEFVKKIAKDEDEIILRPLCAKLLEPTKPEKFGWVDREKLLGLNGRDRKPQLKLAQEFGFSEYASPGGGCLLTVSSFTVKIKDYLKNEKEMNDTDLNWLKFGRHLRLQDGSKMVIGRDAQDNKSLVSLNNTKFNKIEFNENIIGGISFLSNNATDEESEFAAKLALAYTKADKDKSYTVSIGEKTFNIKPFEDKSIAQDFLVR